jgi:hypothetical protein
MQRFARTIRQDIEAVRNAVGAVEQRADRRTDQQAEDPQASHVWPRQHRSTPRSHGAGVGPRLAPATNDSSHGIVQLDVGSNSRVAAQNVPHIAQEAWPAGVPRTRVTLSVHREPIRPVC